MKLVDFGSGAVTDGGAHNLTGTPLYMSPEVLPVLGEFQRTGVLPKMEGVDYYKADVYSLGVTFLHLAVCEPPIRLLTSDRPSAVSFYLSQIQQPYPYLHYLLSNMLEKEPSSRPVFQTLYDYVESLFQSTIKPETEAKPTETVTTSIDYSSSTQSSELSNPFDYPASQSSVNV